MAKIKLKEIKNSRGSTNWDVVRRQTDEEIQKAASSSPDSKLLTEFEISELRRENSEQGTE